MPDCLKYILCVCVCVCVCVCARTRVSVCARVCVYLFLYRELKMLVAQSCQSLRDPMDCSTPGFPVLHSLPEFAQTHVLWVSDAILTISSYPFLLLPSILPRIRVSSKESTLQIVKIHPLLRRSLSVLAEMAEAILPTEYRTMYLVL